MAPPTPITTTLRLRSRRDGRAAYNAAHPEVEEQPKAEVSYNYEPPEFEREAGKVKQLKADARGHRRAK
jgi:hypothetical protein